jgi:hypothetical protein
MEAVIYIMAYIILGMSYLGFKYYIMTLPDLWSPIQPLAFIVLWPLVLTYDLLVKINNEIKNLKSS